MVAATSGPSSKSSKMEYIKRYESNVEEEKKKKKRKKNEKPQVTSIVVVDEDPVWQKEEKLEEDEDSADEEKPLINEDIEVKRMKKLEQVRSLRPYGVLSEDGSGWLPVSETPKSLVSADQSPDLSPPRRQRARNDTPSPESMNEPSHVPVVDLKHDHDEDISPARKRRARFDSPSPEPVSGHGIKHDHNADLSPPRKPRARLGSHSQEPISGNDVKNDKNADISPPRKRRARFDSPSPEPKAKPSDAFDADLSPPRRSRQSISEHKSKTSDVPVLPDIYLSRRDRRNPSYRGDSEAPLDELSAPSKSRKDKFESLDVPPQQSNPHPTADASRVSSVSDLSPPRKVRESTSLAVRRTGLVSGQDIKEEIAKIKEEEFRRFDNMDPSETGRGAEAVYRDKKTGKRLTKEQMKSQKEEEKPKEIQLEWGKGLAQKREAEAKKQELEMEKDKPFARTRDDPDLDNMLKERVRWGDPMAHLVKKKHHDLVLPDMGDDEKMKESGFIVPQDIPSHSWLKRGVDAAPNRYGIRPGRHWDGVDRSTGFEKEMFKSKNEKQAMEKEAYLWSVSDM